MSKRMKFVIGIGVMLGLLLGVGVVITRHAPRTTHRAEVIYYCPMHPTYTSDRPGDCPICNMKLVKQESSEQLAVSSQEPKSAKEICYMHDCPMMKDGQPCPMLVVAEPGEEVT